MASPSVTRFWRTYREAGRPIPRLHEDDVIDFMLLEAIHLKTKKEDYDAQREAEKTQAKETFKKDFSGLDQFR